ncbi:MAG TPA: hypothetical protein VIS96_04350 [Terrimicrobiaceae bacterium]
MTFVRDIVNTYDLKRFIEDLVIPDLHKMIECQLHYYAFSVICQAIEVLGSIYDQKSLDDYGASETRFDNAITNLFRDKRYREKQELFYSFLRGPLIHQLRPGAGLFLASEQKDRIKQDNHLEKHVDSGSVILVIERFLADFIDAFEKFKRELNQRKDLDNKKVEQPFIYVSTLSPPYPTNWWDKDSQSLVTVTPSITGRSL